jgi:hypothetical protein
MAHIQRQFDRITERVADTTVEAGAEVALDCLGRSGERAPVDTGDLRGSGFAEVNQATVAMGNEDGSISVLGTPGQPAGNEIEAAVGFTAPHAFVQHEHTEFNHPKGGQAKFLESVVVENGPKWGKYLADAARKGLRGDEP